MPQEKTNNQNGLHRSPFFVAQYRIWWYNRGRNCEVIGLKLVLKYLKGYEKQCVLGPLFKLLEASFELLIPLVVARIVDHGILTGDTAYVVKMCAVMIALGIIGLVMAVSAQYFSAVAAVGFSTKLRHAVMKHILGLSYSQCDSLGTSTMVTRMTSDINQVQNGVNLTLRLLLRSPFVVFGAMIMAFTIDFQAAGIFAILILLLCVIVFGIMLITMPLYRRVQSSLDSITSSTRQNLSGVRVLRAFCKEEEEIIRFRRKTEELTSRQKHAGSISALMNPVTLVIVNLSVILLVQLGAVKVEQGILTQGLVIALYNYMSQILVELIKMANLIISLSKAVACGKRIETVLELESSRKSGTCCADHISGAVEFEAVTMRYGAASEPVLENISFSAAAGQTIGIIGGTGSGKTTLVNLIPGLYPASEGVVRIDGIPVEAYCMESLRQQIGIVPQKAMLFKGTIRQNLLWGREDATEDDLWNALEIAQAREIVKGKPEELDNIVEQGGVNFSGGQRQRLTIARALVRQPRILILDDSSSALDYATDAALRMALRGLQNAPTIFIVSQRAASVRHADQILVLDDGELVGAGTHDMLLKTCSVYQEIYYSQFAKEADHDAE